MLPAMPVFEPVFTAGVRALLYVDRRMRAEGLDVIGVVHSHTHTDAYPSPTDVAAAAAEQKRFDAEITPITLKSRKGDTLFARDGEKDSVDCGGGADTANVDQLDVVAFCASDSTTFSVSSGSSRTSPTTPTATTALCCPPAAAGPARVVELGSMSRAALDLQLVQSALSQQISRLEGELSTRLLQRTSKGAAPTEAGLAFFREAQLALRHADQAARAAHDRVARGSDAHKSQDVALERPQLRGWR